MRCKKCKSKCAELKRPRRWSGKNLSDQSFYWVTTIGVMMQVYRILFVVIIFLFNFANSQAWGPAQIMPKHGNGFIMNTDLICFNDTCLITAWDQDTSGNVYTDNIYVSIKTGLTWTYPVSLSEPNVECTAPRMCVDHNNIVHLIWGVNSIGFIGRVDKLAYSFWNGSSWSSYEYIVSNATIAEGSYHISYDANGNLHIMYGIETAPDPDRRIRHIWRIGNTWNGPEIVEGSLDFHFVTDRSNITQLVYQDALISNHNNDVYYKHLDSICGSWFGPYVVHYSGELDTLSYWPRIIVDNQLRKHVCWSEDLNDDMLAEKILYSYSDGDSIWANPEDVTGSLSLALMIICRSMVVDSFNNLHITYGYYADSMLEQGRIGYQCRQNSTWSTPFVISQSTTRIGTSRLASDDVDNLHIIWVADTLGDKYVCYRTKRITGVKETNVINKLNIAFNVTPNPVQDIARVSFYTSTAGMINLKLFDITGRLIESSSYFQKNPGWYFKHMDLSNIAAGTYILLLKSNSKIYSKLIIKIDK